MLKIKVLKTHPDAIVPEYKSVGAAGFDFHALTDVYVAANQSATVRTGIAFELPQGFELQVRGRSSLAFKKDVLAFLGTIDSDFRGEVMVKLFNLGKQGQHFEAGERIAQGIINKVEQAKFIESDSLSDTERGTSGFGSTGRV